MRGDNLATISTSRPSALNQFAGRGSWIPPGPWAKTRLKKKLTQWLAIPSFAPASMAGARRGGKGPAVRAAQSQRRNRRSDESRAPERVGQGWQAGQTAAKSECGRLNTPHAFSATTIEKCACRGGISITNCPGTINATAPSGRISFSSTANRITTASSVCALPRIVSLGWVRDIKVEIPATPLAPPDRSTSGLSAFIGVHRRPNVLLSRSNANTKTPYWPPMNADETPIKARRPEVFLS